MKLDRESRLQRMILNVQGLVVFITGALCLFTCYLVFIKAPPVKTGSALLPAPSCTRGKPSPLTQDYKSSDFQILYAPSGCNATTGYTPINVATELAQEEQALSALGLSQPAAPVTLALGSAFAGGERAFPSPGNPGAIELAASGASVSGNPLLQGLAELSLADSASGLSAHSRRRVASALIMLTSGASVSAAERLVSAGNFSADTDGLYDAWIVARFGRPLLFSALSHCRQTCDWPASLAAALAGAAQNPDTLLSQFLARAVSARLRAALRRELLSNG